MLNEYSEHSLVLNKYDDKKVLKTLRKNLLKKNKKKRK